jgi:hypothetical protein
MIWPAAAISDKGSCLLAAKPLHANYMRTANLIL